MSDVTPPFITFQNGYTLQMCTHNLPAIFDNNNTELIHFGTDGVFQNFVAANEETGAGSAALGANCPAVTVTAPYRWLEVKLSDGSLGFVPVWK